MRTGRVCGVLITGALLLGLSACDWPMPAHDADRTNANPGELTLMARTVSGLTQAFAIPVADGAGQPVVSGGHVLVTSGREVRSYDASSGAPAWATTLPGDPSDSVAVGPYPGSHAGFVRVGKDGGYWESTLLDGSWTGELDAATGALFPTWSEGVVAARRGDEEVRLQRSVLGGPGGIVEASVQQFGQPVRWSGPVKTTFGYGTPTPVFRPTLGRNRLYGNLDGVVVAYDLATPCTDPLECNTAWSLPIGASTEVVLSADESTAYVGTQSGYLLALDTSTGAVRWYASFQGAPVTATPALAGGQLFVAVESPSTSSGALVALDADGCGRTVCSQLWGAAFVGTVTAQPAVAGDVVYVGDDTGVVRAFGTAGCTQPSCDPVWTGQVTGAVDGGISVVDGRLFVGSASALTVFALPAG